MKQFDPVENWITSVSISHSQSKATEVQYKRVWSEFSSFISKSAKQILADYETSEDRIFRRVHADYIRSWIASQVQKGLTNTSIKVKVGAVKSFYKYNDLPLGLVPQARNGIVYHNRDLTKEEIIQIMSVSKIREKTFFVIMAQSGLRPHTIKQLKLKNLESLDNKPPCKIDIPQEITKGKYGSYVTFIGSDAIKYLKQYLATRTNLTKDSLLFCSHTDPTKMINVKDESRAFRMAARKLEESGALNFEIREGKPSELRLYNLRKFFRKYANQMGFEHVNYIMGHTTKGSDSNYTPKDPEWYRDLYKEKAMPFLRIETATPTETEKAIAELKKQLEERDKEIVTMKETMAKLQPLVDWVNHYPTIEQMKEELGIDKEYDKGDELRSYKTMEEVVEEFERGEARLEALAKQKGLPMTKEEYEERKRKLGKTSR